MLFNSLFSLSTMLISAVKAGLPNLFQLAINEALHLLWSWWASEFQAELEGTCRYIW